jgi:Na+-driven multidrug efflux pump
MVLTREQLAGLFADDPAIIESFSSYISIAAWGYAGFGILITTNGALNAIDRAGTALVLSAARVGLIMLPVAALLQASWGENGIFTGELVANLGGGAMAIVLVLVLFRDGKRRRAT